MIQKGLLPIPYKDHRTYSFNATFGTIDSLKIPEEFNFNVLKIFRNQNADGFPQACTAYAQTSIAGNEDGTDYNDVEFTYRKTLGIDGSPFGQPCNIMSSFKAGTVYGVKRKIDDEKKALENRRAPFFIVKKTEDYYSAVLSAMWIKQGGISIGTPWLNWFESIGQDGVIPPLYIDPKMSFVNGHNWIAYGQKIVNGEPRLICVSHQGQNYGNGGECYFSRDQVNALLSITGSGAFGQKHATPEDIRLVKMTLIEVCLSFMWQLFFKIKPTDSPIIPTPKPMPPVTPQPPVEPKIDMITKWAKIIAELEGGLVELNNPGNFKYSALMSSFGGKMAKKASDGGYFCTFPDYQTGFNALCSFLKLGCQNQLIGYHNARTIKEFTLVYTNHPKPAYDYSDTLIKKLGVTANTDISTFI